ncbi:MAG: TadA family conjugal transfer-associated ATPase [Jatrophihabitantaceae bacterium]
MTGPLVERVRQRLAGTGNLGLDAELTAAAGRESAYLLDASALSELSGQVRAELTGAGPLEPLLADPAITDVLVNGADQVWLDRGRGLERSPVRFEGDAEVRRLATRLAAQAGRRLDDAMPFVDAVLADGTRLHAILPPLVQRPTLSLRILGRRRLTIGNLIEFGALTAGLAALLAAVVRARLSVLISGGTGTGKTSLLGAMLAGVAANERIVTIEDAAELCIEHPHVVALLARTANVERAGAVALAELVRQALRMRADRLVVGEFRGAEIVELLAALNTGHSGGAATVHANSVADVPARLVALAALAGMPADTLSAQAASALDVLVHIRRDQAGTRRVDQLALWPRQHGLSPQLIWTRAAGFGPAADELAARLVLAGVEPPPMLASR